MNARADSGTRLTGRRLTFARLAWFALTLMAIVVLIIATPVYNHQMITLSGPDIDQPEVLAANQAKLGLSPGFFVSYFMAVGYAFALIYLIVAILVFIRRSDDRVALLFTLFLVIFGIIFTNIPTALEAKGGLGQWSYRLLNYLSFALFIFAFYIFPNGRFDPAWTRWWALLWVILPVPSFFLEGTPLDFSLLHNPIIQVGTFIFPVVSILFGTIYRYMQKSNALERQQTKRVVFGISVGLTAFVAGALPYLIAPEIIQPGTLFYFIVQTLFFALMAFIPLSIGMAIMRSRLWDIDILIRRTLIYSALTALLMLVYFGIVIMLQEAFHVLTGEGSPLAVVVSTVAIAALFSPLRRAIQNGIDRRFYRQHYDAANILMAFEASVRDEVDLNALIERLLIATQETLHPIHASLWLRKSRDGLLAALHDASGSELEAGAE